MIETGSWGGTKGFFVDDVKAPVLISYTVKKNLLRKLNAT